MKENRADSAAVDLPDKLFSADHLSASAIALYCFIAYNKSLHGAAPSKEEGMRALSMGRDTYAKHMSSLIKAGLIRVTENRRSGKFMSPDILLYGECNTAVPDPAHAVSAYGKKPGLDLPYPEKPDPKKPDTVKAEKNAPGLCSDSDLTLNSLNSGSKLNSKPEQNNIIYNNNFNNKSSSSHSEKQTHNEKKTEDYDFVFHELLNQYSVNQKTQDYNLLRAMHKVYIQLIREGEVLPLSREGLLYAMGKFKQVQSERKIYVPDRYLKTFLPSALLEHSIGNTLSHVNPAVCRNHTNENQNSSCGSVTNGEITRFYEHVKRQNHRLFEKRKQEIFTKMPEAERLHKAVLSAIAAQNFASLEQNRQKFKEAEKKLQSLEAELYQLLDQYGYEKDALEPIESCPHCHDTGFLSDGNLCSCREKVKKMIAEQKENEQNISKNINKEISQENSMNQEAERNRLQSIA